eukprot:3013085-Amphidinium_carterae.2
MRAEKYVGGPVPTLPSIVIYLVTERTRDRNEKQNLLSCRWTPGIFPVSQMTSGCDQIRH